MRPEDADWVFRAEFSLGADQEIRVRRTILRLPTDGMLIWHSRIVGLPLSLALAVMLTGGICTYVLGEPEFGGAMAATGAEISQLGILAAAFIALSVWGFVYAFAFWRRPEAPRQLGKRSAARRPVVFEAGATGFSWTAPGTSIQGTWSSAEAIWEGKDGLAVVRGGDVAFVPRDAFRTEADFVGMVDKMTRSAQAAEVSKP